MRAAIFFAINKNYETQNETNCISHRQSTGQTGGVVICQNSFFRATGKKIAANSEKLRKKSTFQKIRLFSITEQLFAKLLSHSKNRVGHH